MCSKDGIPYCPHLSLQSPRLISEATLFFNSSLDKDSRLITDISLLPLYKAVEKSRELMNFSRANKKAFLILLQGFLMTNFLQIRECPKKNPHLKLCKP